MSSFSAPEIKKIVSASKACKIYERGAKLESRFGSVTFDLTEFFPGKCDIYCKRLSGNGKIVVKTGDKYNDNKIISKISQKISIDIEDGKVNICRPNDGDGEILIFGLEVHDSPLKGDSELAVQWKDIIKKCGKYNKIRLIGDRLFATTNGYIEDDYKICQIETQPDGVSQRDSNRVKFLNSCEILKIVLTDNTTVQQSIIQPFIHRNPPTPIPKTRQEIAEDAIKQVKEGGILSVQEIHKLADNDNIVYNSSSNRGFSNYSCNNTGSVKSIRSNGKEFIIVRKGGSVCLPVSSLKGNTDYICIIKGKKLNGNGKCYMNFVTLDSDFSDMTPITFSNMFSDKQAMSTTRPTEHGKSHKLHISMLDNCVGEILIENIIIVEGVPFLRNTSNSNYYSFTKREQSSAFGQIVDSSFINDPICLNFKKYARFDIIDKCRQKYFDVKANIATTTISGLSWFSKISSSFPEIKSIKYTSDFNNTTLISSLNSVQPAKKIWVDVFKEEEMYQPYFDKLTRCETIFTPSPHNLEIIKSKCPNSNIKLLTRQLPFFTPREVKYFTNQNYIVSFCRDEFLIKQLIQVWNNDLPKLALVGTRGRYPNYVLPINEYLPFDELIYIMIKSKGIIDLNSTPEYKSAMIELCMALGIPVASNNWNIMFNDNAAFIPCLELLDRNKVPCSNSIYNVVDKLNNIKTQNSTEEYINRFNSTIRELFV